MKNHEYHGCGNVGKWVGMLFGALGVATAFLMVYLMNGGWLIGLDPAIAVGLVVEIFAAAFLGERAGRYLCGKGNPLGRAMLVGVGVAFGSIAIAVYAGTIAGVVAHPSEFFGNSHIGVLNVLSVLFFPLFMVLFFGGIPAAVLGVVYGTLIHVRLQKLNPQ
ncbi:MAG TPA: hypothetical protein VFR51_11155 [Pyrinomonadaceae bacterium]|nr:hypothetical protein [Pyrinomonadaceae bacterium]